MGYQIRSFLLPKKNFLIYDKDALFFLQNHEDWVKGYSQCVLTPNVAEASRLFDAFKIPNTNDPIQRTKELAAKLGGVTILEKGKEDVITDGTCGIKY